MSLARSSRLLRETSATWVRPCHHPRRYATSVKPSAPAKTATPAAPKPPSSNSLRPAAAASKKPAAVTKTGSASAGKKPAATTAKKASIPKVVAESTKEPLSQVNKGKTTSKNLGATSKPRSRTETGSIGSKVARPTAKTIKAPTSQPPQPPAKAANEATLHTTAVGQASDQKQASEQARKPAAGQAEEARKRQTEEEYKSRYKSAAWRWTSAVIAWPILLVTSYFLFDRSKLRELRWSALETC